MSNIGKPTIHDVKEFWEHHPLFVGESKYEPGTKEFFEEHRKLIIDDCLGGEFRDDLYIPPNINEHSKILDLGCGVGFWTIEFLMRGYTAVYSGDLTEKAIELTRKRLEIYGLNADLSVQNAEKPLMKTNFLII